MRPHRLRITLVALAIAGAATACSGGVASESVAAEIPDSVRAAPAGSIAALPDFASLVDRYGAAVVNVTVIGKAQPVADMPGMSPNDPFYEFFRRFGRPMPRGQAPQPRGEGSGFIVSSD